MSLFEVVEEEDVGGGEAATVAFSVLLFTSLLHVSVYGGTLAGMGVMFCNVLGSFVMICDFLCQSTAQHWSAWV